VPERDLLVSPQHAIFAQGVLIPAKYLVNNTTVLIEEVPDVEYFHVELHRHNILLAEGLRTESYLESGDRGDFENGGQPVRLHPDFAAITWDACANAELKVDGPELEAVKRKLTRRAKELSLEQAHRPAGNFRTGLWPTALLDRPRKLGYPVIVQSMNDVPRAV
jgi:hypothetical protein